MLYLYLLGSHKKYEKVEDLWNCSSKLSGKEFYISGRLSIRKPIKHQKAISEIGKRMIWAIIEKMYPSYKENQKKIIKDLRKTTK